MKIVFFAKDLPPSDDKPGLTSAYSQCTYELLSRLIKQTDHEFHILSTVGLEQHDTTLKIGGKEIPCYCGLGDKIAPVDRLNEIERRINPDLYFFWYDAWCLPDEFFDSPIAQKLLYYAALDFYPFPQRVVTNLNKCLGVITMVNWAKKILKEENKLQNVLGYIYHGCSPKFRPLGKSKTEIIKNNLAIRKSLGADEDSFLILMVFNNQTRKNISQMFEGIAIFRQQNPDIKLRVYCHSQHNISNSYNLIELANYYHIDDIMNIPNPTQYYLGKYTQEDLNKIYNVSNLLLNVQMEGFGCPTIESMATGTPVIGLNVGATKELMQPFLPELLVPAKTWYTFPPAMLRKPLPDPQDIANAIKYVYDKGAEYWFDRLYKAEIGKKFNWDEIAKLWVKALNMCEELLDRKCLKMPKPNISEKVIEYE